MHEPLIAAYNASRDRRYGAFVAMIPGYAPNLFDRPPLPNGHLEKSLWPSPHESESMTITVMGR
jgi:hypothetical protein